jgi:hypothetical protein
VEGYLKKQKKNGKLSIFSKYVKRYFILDLEKGIISYADEKGKKPSTIIMVRV